MIDRLSSLFIIIITCYFIKKSKIIRIFFYIILSLMILLITYCVIVEITTAKNTKTIVEEDLDISLSKCQIIKEEDKNNFLGIGYSVLILDCAEHKDYYKERPKGWLSLPMSKELNTFITEKNVIPLIEKGYYKFFNRMTDSIEDTFDDSPNFTLAIYDIDANLLYCYVQVSL